MAPVMTRLEESLIPITTLGTHVSLAIFLTILISRTNYQSYLALPPSQGTRNREVTRRNHVKLFSALAILSLGLAGYWSYSFADVSYRIWADQRGIELPQRFFGENSAFEHPRQIVRWLSDTSIYEDALEIVAERAGRYWWRQQLDLSNISWGMLVTIEGRRRNIPHLWAYLLLAQLVSLSFAQNLFYLTLLLTPVPLPDREAREPRLTRLARLQQRTAKPENWCPSPILYLVCIISSFSAVAVTPSSTNTTSFVATVLLTRFLPFLPLTLPYIVPEKWGTVHQHPHDTHSTYNKLFKTISLLSFLLHGKSTIIALFYNDPGSHHRHSLFHPFRHRSAFERSTTSVGRVLGAIRDHPAVGAVGWDVLISGLSLGLWAVARGNIRAILANYGFTGTEEIKEEIVKVGNVEKFEPTTSRRRGRPRKNQSIDSTNGSTRKSKKDADKAYVPIEPVLNEGDDIDEDWEAGALTWGIISAMGLGVGSAGVYGAEIVPR